MGIWVDNMKYKKSLIFIFLFLCFLSIAGVCASDAGDVNIQTGNGTVEDVVALGVDSDESDDAIASQEVDFNESDDAIASQEVDFNESDDAIASQEETGQDTVASSDENDELGMGVTFLGLQYYVNANKPGHTLNLASDYSMIAGGKTVSISNNITIDGKGHTLSGDNLHTIFEIGADGLDITFKNIIFKNGGAKAGSYTDERGGAILNPHPNTAITIINCVFNHNGVLFSGGAIYTNGNLTVLDSKFYKNIAETANGGAIFCRGYLLINNTEFEGNEVQKSTGFKNQILQMFGEKYYYDGEHHITHDDSAYLEAEKLIQQHHTVAAINDLYIRGQITGDEAYKRLKEACPDYTFDESTIDDLLIRVLDGLEASVHNAQYYNNAPMSGGAIFSQGKCLINNSVFKNNIVGTDEDQIGTSGGAIHCKSDLVVHNSTFIENSVNDWGGGAIFSEKKCTIYGSSFEDNTANKGCAVYCWDETKVYDSEFSYNHHIEDSTWLERLDPAKELLKTIIDTLCEDIPFLSLVIDKVIDKKDLGTKVFFPSEGGAIWSGGKCLIDSCTFDNNNVMEHGGAIYAASDLNITGHDNLFHHNVVGRTSFGGFYKSGGAIYCMGNLFINNTGLYYNIADSDGGAIYCQKESNIYNSIFQNNAATWKNLFKLESCEGGAIKTERLGEYNNCIFINNGAGDTHSSYKGLYAKGGAIYINGECHPKLISCRFEGNKAIHHGGAIYTNSPKSKLNVISCEFKSNHAIGDGGAIYASGESTITDSRFNANYLKETLDNKHGVGGAIYASQYIKVENSNFTSNSVEKSGGAIYADYGIEVINSLFAKNNAEEGGAIYHKDQGCIKISGSTFDCNSAKSGGAIYVVNVMESLINSKFSGNEAKEGDGGAIHANSVLRIDGVSFEKNSASHFGGAIYAKTAVYGKKSIFDSNSAKSGGAIYTYTIGQGRSDGIQDMIFTNNKATAHDGDGGAIYVSNYKDWVITNIDTVIRSCRFEGNTAQNVGGAIFFGSKAVSLYQVHLEVLYCTFINNHANQKSYSQGISLTYRSPGHSIFSYHSYQKLDGLWMGTNDPNFKGQFAEYNFGNPDSDWDPKYLTIGIKLNETEIYAGNTYKATIYFDKNQHDILHSDGKFYGDANFSNFTLGDRNEMTADVIFTSGEHVIYGKLDNQVVSLKVNSNIRGPSEVHIISCDDIRYPNQLNVTYEILNMSDNAFFVIKDIQGQIVKQGNLTDPNTLLVDGLRPGSYTLIINNPESRSHLSSSANTTFSVLKGSFDLRIVVFNETYPDMAECNLYSNGADAYDYVLTVTGDSGIVYSKTVNFKNIAHFDMDKFDAGNYTAKISFIGNEYYNPVSNLTSFTVFREGVSFEIEIVPGEIDYGGIAKVIPVFGDNVNGTVVYHLHNGTFLAELSAGENLTLPLLDVGHYVIIANYSGDRDHEPAFDSAHIIVNKAKPVFKIEGDSVRYGENATVIAILPSTATGTVRYYWANGTFLGEAAVNENLTLPVLDAGSYLIIANYSGDKNFINATANATLTINKAESEIFADPIIVMYNSNGDLLIILKDIYGNPIGGVNVTVDLNGVKNYTTDQYGQAFVSTNNLRVGKYNVTIGFNGNDNYLNCSNTTNVTVTKMTDTMAADPLVTVYQVHKYLVINLKDELNKPIANEYVIITINGVSYKCKTDANGNARLIIRLDARTYTAKVTFVNANYESATKYVKVIVRKATPKIIAKKKTFKAKKKIKKYAVTLKVHGDALAKVKVTLKIKGKTYKAKTNSKGKAIFKIKKLTKKGKFKATITYKGNYLYNKVTKKVKIVCSK